MGKFTFSLIKKIFTVGQQEGTIQYRLAVIRAFVLLVATFFAFFHVWLDITSLAVRDEEFSHILLVPFVAIWLVWCRLDRPIDIFGSGRSWGLALVMAAFILHELGLLYSSSMLWHSSGIVCLLGGLTLALGTKLFKQCLPAVSVLLLMIPIPGTIRQQLTLPLQYHAARLTENILSLFGIPIEQQGVTLLLDGVTLTVAEACTGIRMLVAITLIVYAICFTFDMRPRIRILLLLCSPAVAMLLNTLRLIMTVLCYHLLPADYAEQFHDISGWVLPMAFLGLVVSLALRNRLRCISPLSTQDSGLEYQPRLSTLGAVTLIAIASYTYWIPPDSKVVNKHHEAVYKTVTKIPYAIDAWVADEKPLDPEEVELLKPLVSFRRKYCNTLSREQITMVLIACRHTRDMVGHEPGVCLPGQGWTIDDEAECQWNVAGASVKGVRYAFTTKTNGIERNRSVVSVLILPTNPNVLDLSDTTTGDMSKLCQVAGDIRTEPFGSVGIQFHWSDTQDKEGWHKKLTPFVEQLVPIVNQFQESSRSERRVAFGTSNATVAL